MKNHSQLEELKKSKEEIYNRVVGRKDRTSNLPGIETPLGHAYSLILEELFKEKLDVVPNLSFFLETIKKEVIRGGNSYEAKYIDSNSPCYYGRETTGIMNYMLNKRLSNKGCEKVMKEILGPDCGVTFAPEYKSENITRFFKRKI